MNSSITSALYEWLRERRLITAVAQHMGIPQSTLYSELSNRNHQAKLGADGLVPLFRAIREIQYGSELEGIVRRFVKELEGEPIERVDEEQFGPLLLALMGGIGALSESAAHVHTNTAEEDLIRLKTKIRTEIVPAVFKLEDIVESRLALVRQLTVEGRAPASVEPEPIHTGA